MASGNRGLLWSDLNGARRDYGSLSPEAVELAERVLPRMIRELTAPPDLTGMEKIRRRWSTDIALDGSLKQGRCAS